MYRETICIVLVLALANIRSSEAGFIDDSDRNTEIISPEVTPIYLKEGDTLNMTCHQKEGKEVEWFSDTTKIDSTPATGIEIINKNVDINGVQTVVSTINKMNVTRKDSAIYACKPKGENGKGYNVKVEVFKMEGVDAVVDDDERTATLGCIVTGVSSYKPINWLREGKQITLDNEKYQKDEANQTLKISRLRASDMGIYQCSITLNNKMTFETEAKVKGKPEISNSQSKSKNTVQGDTFILHCEASGYPLPEIEWNFAKKPLNVNDKRITLKDHKNAKEQTLVNGTLNIKELVDNDKGLYTCIASNDFGSVNATTLLRVKDKLAALWPFLGIVAEVTILCIIIFIYERRRAKKMEEEDSAEEASHLANSNDHKGKDEIRQRK